MFINQIVSLLSLCPRIYVCICVFVLMFLILDVIVHIIYVWMWKITERYRYNNFDTYEYNMCKYPRFSGARLLASLLFYKFHRKKMKFDTSFLEY